MPSFISKVCKICKAMKILLKYLYFFLKVSWIQTLLFNFIKLSFNKAIHLPILLYDVDNFIFLISQKGEFVISEKSRKINFGMIKLGVNIERSLKLKKGIVIENKGMIIFHGSTIVGNGCSIVVTEGGCLEFGKNDSITASTKIYCQEKILFGNNLSCSWDVSIYDTNFHSCLNMFDGSILLETEPIEIGDNVWICQRVDVSKGTKIPNNFTVASFTLVNKNYMGDAYSVIAGIPGKIVKRKIKRIDFEKQTKIEDWQLTHGFLPYNNSIL